MCRAFIIYSDALEGNLFRERIHKFRLGAIKQRFHDFPRLAFHTFLFRNIPFFRNEKPLIRISKIEKHLLFFLFCDTAFRWRKYIFEEDYKEKHQECDNGKNDQKKKRLPHTFFLLLYFYLICSSLSLCSHCVSFSLTES